MEWIAINQDKRRNPVGHIKPNRGRKEERESANDLADLELMMFSFSMF